MSRRLSPAYWAKARSLKPITRRLQSRRDPAMCSEGSVAM